MPTNTGNNTTNTTIDTDTLEEQNEAIGLSTTFLENYSNAFLGVGLALGTADNALGRFSRTLTGVAMEGFKASLEFTQGHVREMRALTANYRSFNGMIGGLTNHMLAAGKPLDDFAQKSLDMVSSVQQAVAGMGDSQIKYVNEVGETVNAFDVLYDDPKEAMRDMNKISESLINTNSKVQKSVADNAGSMANITRLVKTTAFSVEDANAILARQYAYTGEASDEILEQIVANSVAVGQATGQPLREVQKLTLEIMSDTKTFGDIGVDSAARIGGALSQLGLDFQTFQNMTSNFMNFEDAASKMGDLSAMFGIQMDAMEMTYLANEDQEEFMHRFREEILDAGLDVENMSKSRQRMLAGQLNLSIEQMRNFMRDGEMAVGQDTMMGATETAKGLDGAQEAMEKFADTTAGALREADDMWKTKILGMSSYSIKEFAKSEAAAKRSVTTLQDIKFSPEQIESYKMTNKLVLDPLNEKLGQTAKMQQTVLQNMVDINEGGTINKGGTEIEVGPRGENTGVVAAKNRAVAMEEARKQAGVVNSPASNANAGRQTSAQSPTAVFTPIPQISTAINQNNIVIGELKDMFKELHGKYEGLLDKMKNIGDKEMTFKLEVDGQGLGQAIVNRLSRGNITADDGRSVVLSGGE
jgi:hypothetical protein